MKRRMAMLTALFYSGVFGIDEPGRCALVYRVLRVSIAAVVAIAAVRSTRRRVIVFSVILLFITRSVVDGRQGRARVARPRSPGLCG